MTLYLITFHGIPDVMTEPETILIPTGLESILEGEGEISPDELRFATTLLIRSDDQEAVLDSVREWWRDHGGGAVEAELITSDERLLVDDLRRSARELADHGWSFRDAVVAFKATSPAASAEAREILRSRSIKAQ